MVEAFDRAEMAIRSGPYCHNLQGAPNGILNEHKPRASGWGGIEHNSCSVGNSSADCAVPACRSCCDVGNYGMDSNFFTLVGLGDLVIGVIAMVLLVLCISLSAEDTSGLTGFLKKAEKPAEPSRPRSDL
jgi:hypothetical protein